MTDVEQTRAVERCELPNENFHHLSHLHVAWVYLCESDSTDVAAEKMRATLRRFAAVQGQPHKYHDTITLFWVRLLGALRDRNSAETLDEVVHAHPELLEKNFPLSYYSPKRLFSDHARKSWVDPDLKPLPFDATSLRSSCSSGHASHWALPQCVV